MSKDLPPLPPPRSTADVACPQCGAPAGRACPKGWMYSHRARHEALWELRQQQVTETPGEKA